MGVVVAVVVLVAFSVGDRQTQHRDPMAPARFPSLLALEVAAENGGAAAHGSRDPQVDPPHVS